MNNVLKEYDDIKDEIKKLNQHEHFINFFSLFMKICFFENIAFFEV